MTPTTTLFLFVKGTATTPVEALVAQAQCATALDTLEKMRTIPEIGEMIVATPSVEFAERAATLGARIENDPADAGEFHWGKCLAALIEKYRATVPFYVGGGSGALMSAEDWRMIAQRALAEPNTIITNNYFSCDFAAWSPANALAQIELPTIDNSLAFQLGERTDIHVIALPKNAATQLDIDTPTDLLTISLHPAVGKFLRAFLDSAHLDMTNVQRIQNVLGNRNAMVTIAGRVSAAMTLTLERESRCQWRILSEERGMRATGRAVRGETKSLLGYYLDLVGVQELIHTLDQLGDAAILDSRVVFAHQQLQLSAADRFHSDLIQPEQIMNPFARELTAAVRDAPIPILLGGHSLVSGGMYALIEAFKIN